MEARREEREIGGTENGEAISKASQLYYQFSIQ